jgi:uncharacterized protein YukE
MTEPLSVNVDDLQTAAANVSDVSSQMKQILSTLNGQLAALGSPWGNDSTGDNFANGSGGYLAQVDQVDSSITATTQQLDSLSQSLSSAANNFEQEDKQPGQTSGGGTGNVLLGTGSGSSGGSGGSGGSGNSGGSGASGATGGSGGSGGPGQVLDTVRRGVTVEPRVPAVAATSAADAPTSGVLDTVRSGVTVEPRVLAVPATSAADAPTSGVLDTVRSGVTVQPRVPAVAATSAADAPTSGVPATLPSGATLQPQVPAQPAAPQPATSAGNVLTSVPPGQSSSSAAPSETLSASAAPATETDSVPSSVAPAVGASAPGSGSGGFMQLLEALAQPAGEGVSAAMEAGQSGSSAGSPANPSSRTPESGTPAPNPLK